MAPRPGLNAEYRFTVDKTLATDVAGGVGTHERRLIEIAEFDRFNAAGE
ncbi:MAG: hypothetical protein WAO61_02725 [Solirubrobacterales bacterium]